MAQKEELLRRVFDSLDESACSSVAAATARLVQDCMNAPSSPPVGLRIFLHGELGAGKTTWVRAFLRACGVEGRIRSPSFSVVESYEVHGLALHHLDFYRQSDPDEWQGGGLRDLLTDPAVSLIEWPEKANGLPDADIDVRIDWSAEMGEEGPRRLEMTFMRHPGGRDLAPGLERWRAAVNRNGSAVSPDTAAVNRNEAEGA